MLKSSPPSTTCVGDHRGSVWGTLATSLDTPDMMHNSCLCSHGLNVEIEQQGSLTMCDAFSRFSPLRWKTRIARMFSRVMTSRGTFRGLEAVKTFNIVEMIFSISAPSLSWTVGVSDEVSTPYCLIHCQARRQRTYMPSMHCSLRQYLGTYRSWRLASALICPC